MNKLEQAARQALEALEEMFHSNSTKVAVEKYNTAHNALREALAEQAEQEPVAWMCSDPKLLGIGYSRFSECCAGVWNIPVYAAPVRTKDLTDDEIYEFVCTTDSYKEFARAVIAADRELNK